MLLMDGFGCCRGRLLKWAPSVNRELSFQPDSQGIFLKWMDFPSLHGGSSGEAVSNVTACACERAFVCEASRKMLVRPHDTTDRSVFCATCESLELSRRFKMTLLCKLTKLSASCSPPPRPLFFLKYLGCEAGAKIWIGDKWCHAWQLNTPGTSYLRGFSNGIGNKLIYWSQNRLDLCAEDDAFCEKTTTLKTN